MSEPRPVPTEQEFRAAVIEDIRPWGKFRSYPSARAAAVKIITVNPGAALSLQFHHRRSEFWVVLDEGLEMTIGDRTWRTAEGEEIYIPREAPHRLRCVGPSRARVMEIWLGDGDEADIVRLRDDYGRGEPGR
ncbi:MAG: phosphomannose isomerase type II C-terminal cupin domain [Candidatus Aminicenantes bacterium]|nr:phosphomannose isomerase type II C-terminal cupin domain [Candidatus Aminicenantes bacterium]